MRWPLMALHVKPLSRFIFVLHFDSAVFQSARRVVHFNDSQAELLNFWHSPREQRRGCLTRCSPAVIGGENSWIINPYWKRRAACFCLGGKQNSGSGTWRVQKLEVQPICNTTRAVIINGVATYLLSILIVIGFSSAALHSCSGEAEGTWRYMLNKKQVIIIPYTSSVNTESPSSHNRSGALTYR